MATSEAISVAADQVIEKARALAADRLEAALTDITHERGVFRVAGTDRTIALMDLARTAPEVLTTETVADTPPSAFPNGAHLAEVEIDPETGHIDLVRYLAVDDFGTVVNPMLVDGQVHGGIAQGAGQVLLEQTVYSTNGQLLSGSFMDYALPRADQIPNFELVQHGVPATTSRIGAKGCGEAGITGALPVIMLAILDGLRPLGVEELDMPATPERVWRAIREARDARNGLHAT